MNSHTNTPIEQPSWLKPATWPFPVETCAVGDTRLAYTDVGEGPTILLVHDGMWSILWLPLIERLRTSMRVVTLDFPGSGLTPESGATSSLESDAGLLGEFVRALDLDNLTIGVHDLGGSVGLGMAVRDPARIDGVVAMNSFAWRPDTTGLTTMLRLMGSAPMRVFDQLSGLIPWATSTRYGLGVGLDSDQRTAFRRGMSIDRFHKLMGAALSETHFLADLENRLPKTLGAKPLLTIFGEKNDPFGFQQRFRRYFDDITEMIVSGGHHFPMTDATDAVAARILGWHREKVATPAHIGNGR